MVTSDHGEEFYDHEAWGHSHSVYDELIRVPLVIKLPGGANRGRRLKPVVRLTEIMPTILDLAGADYDPEILDGRSLRPIMDGRETSDRRVQAELADSASERSIPQRVAVRDGYRKLILNQPFTEKQFGVFTPPPRVPARLEFFDLRSDPGETRNLAEAPERAAEVREMLRKAEEIARLVPKRGSGETPMNPELERQLRTLGYIR